MYSSTQDAEYQGLNDINRASMRSMVFWSEDVLVDGGDDTSEDDIIIARQGKVVRWGDQLPGIMGVF